MENQQLAINNLSKLPYLTVDIAKNCCKISCYIQVKSSKCGIVGLHDKELKIALTAPPVDGQANAMLIKYLATYLKKPKRDIEIITGETSRHKIVMIKNINDNDLAKIYVDIP